MTPNRETQMQTFEIKNRWNGKVLFSAGGESLRDVVQQAVMRGADLSGADLRSANLRGANLSGAYLSGADLSSADLGSAYLRSADLSGADLSGADLSSAYLRGAYLSGADGKQLALIGRRPLLTIGPIGSRCDYLTAYLTAYLTDAGVYVRAGCFFDTIEAFRAAVVAEHGENEHGREYMAAIAMIEAHAAIWSSAAVAVKEVA